MELVVGAFSNMGSIGDNTDDFYDYAGCFHSIRITLVIKK